MSLPPAGSPRHPPSPIQRPLQFQLVHLLGLMLWVGVLAALITQAGVGPTFIFLILSWVGVAAWLKRPWVTLLLPALFIVAFGLLINANV